MTQQNSVFRIKDIIAIVIGNAIEIYDFVIFSFMSMIISQLFFPYINQTNALLATLATFGVAFFMRPLGGIILSIYADHKGRKPTLTIIIAMMTAAMLILVFAPTYQTIGIFAPLLLVSARLIQGFATGGEFSTSTALLMELSPQHRRGFYGSLQMVGQVCAILLGAVAGIILTDYLTTEELQAWGWRMPFAIGLLIAPIGIYIRTHLHESFHSQIIVTKCSNDFVKHIREYFPNMCISTGLVISAAASTYINFFYMPTYAVKYLNLSMHESFLASIIGIAITGMVIPIFGWWSDRIGQKPILFVANLIFLLLIYPIFFYLNLKPTVTSLIGVQIILSIIIGAYLGALTTYIAELFPVHIRATSIGLSYNLGVLLFGGFAQFIVTYLIEKTHSPLAIAYYLFLAFSISLFVLLFMNRKQFVFQSELG